MIHERGANHCILVCPATDTSAALVGKLIDPSWILLVTTDDFLY